MGWNSLASFKGDPNELPDAMGITQFGDQNRWHHTIAGLLFQGGIIPNTGTVEFLAPFTKQILAVSVNGGTATNITLTGFTAASGGHWFAVGV
jgi:hypothetical protein